MTAVNTGQKPEVVCLGQFTADVVVNPVDHLPEKGKALTVDRITLHNGGCACNTALALARLAIPAAAMGKVGCDPFGEFLMKRMASSGLNTSGMIEDPGTRTSSTAVLVCGDGERSFLHDPGANAVFTEQDVDWGMIEACRFLHVAAAFLVGGMDGEPMGRVLAEARERGVTTCLDTAWDAEGRWMSLLAPCLAHVDYFLPSLDEARMLCGEEDADTCGQQFLDRGVGTVVIKNGSEGCKVYTQAGSVHVGAMQVDRVVDTLGAGDSFNAGFLAGLVKGWTVEKSCRVGNAVGACCVAGEGASGIVSLEETLQRHPC